MKGINLFVPGTPQWARLTAALAFGLLVGFLLGVYVGRGHHA